ncbi:MAG: sulfite exporter TauE/SafE family protein [Halobacteriales archaeon]
MAASCAPADPLYGSAPVGLVGFFLLGLLGGAHCVGMCGPLVALYSERMNVGSDRPDVLTLGEVRQHFLFNLGRGASYTALGALFGFAGGVVFVTARNFTSVVGNARAFAGIFVGIVVIGVGFGYVSSGSSRSLVPARWVSRGTRFLHGRVTPHIDAWVGDKRIVGLGAVHGILPCPLLYPAFLYAFVQGSTEGGAASLAALAVGTFPAVFLTGTVMASTDVRHRKNLHRVLGIVFVFLGYIPLQHGLAYLGVPLPHVPIPYYQPW